ncbi:solute carrier family 23 protein [Falsiroseomonas sp. CW058]|uniref:solute carrier family 23 protein n=1 Tax=Falsiroseomonas sp. CW058 TaxID=3388664 RepID=UPI003D316FD5
MDANLPEAGATRPRTVLTAWLARRDRPVARPPHLIAAADEVPPAASLLPTLLQQVGTQAVYGILILVVADAFGLAGAEASRFLCLTLLSLGLGALMQAARRGPVGSGYALSLIPTTSMLAPYLLVADAGGGLDQAALLCVASGAIAALAVVLDRRILTAIPTEIAGVVTFAIGASLLPRVVQALDPDATGGGGAALLATAAATFAATGLMALAPGPLARFALPLGALAGTVAALLAGLGEAGAAATLAAAPWLALPVPDPPLGATLDLALLPAFLLGVLANLLSWQSALVSMQRAGDAAWRRPDGGPIRRGLLGAALSVQLAGMLGAMAPGVSSAGAVFAIHARVLSRAVAVGGAALLILLACSPKAATLLVSIPAPVRAAMLLYMACFMMAGGCQTIAARALDTRRTLVAGLALCAVLLTLAAPPVLLAALPPALRSPVMVGAALALALHMATLPLVRRRWAVRIALGPASTQDIADLCARVAGGWGLRRELAARLDAALVELAEVMALHGLPSLDLRLTRREDDELAVQVAFAGAPLNLPAGPAPSSEDLLGDDAAQEGFMLWMALRQAEGVRQREAPGGVRVLEFTLAAAA